MVESDFGETFGILGIVVASFAGAYLVEGLFLTVILVLIGLGILGLWVFRYVAEGMAESQTTSQS